MCLKLQPGTLSLLFSFNPVKQPYFIDEESEVLALSLTVIHFQPLSFTLFLKQGDWICSQSKWGTS